MMKKYFLIPIILICNSFYSQNKDSLLDRIKDSLFNDNSLYDEIIAKGNLMYSGNNFTSEEVLNSSLLELRDSLINDELPSFMYDACYGYISEGILVYKDGKPLSLKKDIIKSLNYSELHKVFTLIRKEDIPDKSSCPDQEEESIMDIIVSEIVDKG
ncbi:MAG: hypothetical protein ACI9N1_001545 [Flavobacteriales bacterium]|jgi:hypothetical protein